MESERELLASRKDLAHRGIEVVCTDRGGRVTYHAPGQLIGYPILKLAEGQERDLHLYLRHLEQALIDTLATFGLTGAHKEGLTGVWVGQKKIAAIGIKIARWVTMHGFALNIESDLAVFRQDIVPCGIPDKDVTSMAECGVDTSRPQVEPVFIDAFCRILERVPEYAASCDIPQLADHMPGPEGILGK
jgi:lipoyl(octanoyl) transferase